MIETLRMYMQYDMVRNALIVGVLIALCSSLLGVTLVLKRFSYIGDGLSHVAFGAIAIAAVLHLSDDMVLVMPVTILCAVLLLRTGQKTRIRGDAAIAMISVGALAVGYLLMNIFSASSNLSGDVCSTLFGSASILTLTKAEVWLSIILSVVVVVIFPAMSAMRLFRSFRAVTIASAVLSVFCALMGILVAILADTPVGSTIVGMDILAFLICAAAARLQGRTSK